MRRKDKTINEQAAIDALLAEVNIGRLGTNGPGGPMIKPVNFVYLNGAFYFHSATEGEKIGHIMADSRVVFQVERVLEYISAEGKPCGANQAYECVIARGKAVIVEDPQECMSALNALMGKHQPEGGFAPLTAKMLGGVAVVRVDVEEMTAKASPARASK